ncbi:MAG: hypothetical protein EA408_11830 [Marinilabiliales bacterium]|nr:MAG: hypothetical protein EA408_11830 [Marinilabiliales bacterium]
MNNHETNQPSGMTGPISPLSVPEKRVTPKPAGKLSGKATLKPGIIFLPVIAFLILTMSSCRTETEMHSYETEITTFRQLTRLFEDPPSEFRAAPFWIWTGDVTEDMIRHSLEELKDKGFGGVFVHPRYGLITEYLSDEWFELFGYTLEVAEELGMYAWIYDENSYPSGFAGGHVPHYMPDSYRHGQALRIHRSDIFEPDPELRYLHYFEVNPQGEMEEIGDPGGRTGDRGSFILFELVSYPQTKWYAGYSYVDLLYPGVTEKFMEITMQGYEERFGQWFGGLIPGVFTDEPNIAPPGGSSAVKWTPDLYDEFEKRWGYRLQDNLMSLFEESGDWKRVRHNYFQLLLQMFIDRWSKPWYEYTEERGLKWTGHYWEHGWPSPHHGGDNMAMYAWHQVPGIDLLFNRMYTEERPTQFGNVRNVKELRSAANQTGRTRTLCEAYGGAGWELTFEDMKRNGDWMYALGVNFMNQHMTYMTLVGDRKHDYPQSFSYHTPWWDMYGQQNEYFARLSVAMSAGRQVNNILVLEPTTSTWMHYSSYSPDPHLQQIGDSFHDLLDLLEQHKVEYDLGSENIIKDMGGTDNGYLVVGEAAYNLVVLPPGMENLDKSTFDLLKTYIETGGRVVSLHTPPSRIDGEVSEAVGLLAERAGNHWIHASCFTDENVYRHFENTTLRFSPEAMQSKWFLHHTRHLDDGRLVLLVNSEPDETVTGHFTARGETVIMLDPHTGDIFSYPFMEVEEGLEVGFSVKPAGSLLLFVADRETDAPPLPVKPAATTVLEITGMEVKPLSSNMMPLDYGELIIEGDPKGNMYFYTAGDRVWRHYGYNDNPWSVSVQFKSELAEADTFADGTGFEFTYDFHVGEGTDMHSITAVAERPEIFALSVNGNTLDPIPGRWFADRDFAVYGIGEHLQAGHNTVSLTVSPMSMFAELHPVYLNGNFSLEEAERGWRIVPSEPLGTGSWKEQGYPFYSDRVSYVREHFFDEKPRAAVVQLGDWKGTVAEVLVNDIHAGIIERPPYSLDISGYLEEGYNKVEVTVYGSLKNLLGPHHNVRRYGIVTPWDYKFAPAQQPPGGDYDLFDYGLMEDFTILVSEQGSP